MGTSVGTPAEQRRRLAPVRQLRPRAPILELGVLEALLDELGWRRRRGGVDRGPTVAATCPCCRRRAYVRRELRPVLRCWPCGARLDVLDQLAAAGLDVAATIRLLDPRGEIGGAA